MTVPLKCVKVWGGERLSLAFQIINGNFAATQCRNGGIGRHEGLKIPWPVMAVRVRVPLAAQRFSCPKKTKAKCRRACCLHALRFFSCPNPCFAQAFPISLHKASCTREIENGFSFRSFALPLHKASCTREIENGFSFRSFALPLQRASGTREIKSKFSCRSVLLP